MEKLKYVRLEQYNQVIIFPLVMEHSTFKHLSPKTAGFCYFNPTAKRIDCFGESVSLGIASNKIEDTYYATRQVFGIDESGELLK
jgi:hypothetical protein